MSFLKGLVILSIAIIAVLLSRKSREKIVGICVTAMDQTVRKNGNKEKILKLLASQSEASNADIRETLGVSRQSVARYMDELERERKVEQIGHSGQGVTY